MSDRTYFQITVADCPAEQAGAIFDLFDHHNISLARWEKAPAKADASEAGWVQVEARDELLLGYQYTAEEVLCGTADDVATWLTERAPAASWVCWEDPAYEWLGLLAAYTPAQGLFRQECDPQGRPVFNAREVLEIVRQGEQGKPLDRLTGEAWTARIAEWSATNGDVRLNRPDTNHLTIKEA